MSVPQKGDMPQPSGLARGAALARSVGLIGVAALWPAFWFESPVLALVAAGAFMAQIVTDVVAGIAYYRDVMRSDWPKVKPLADDDW